MKKTMFKRSALAVAMASAMVMSGGAVAADQVTDGTGDVWSSAATHTGADLDNADANDNVAIGSGHTLTITNDGTANDGSANTNTFAVGNITDSADNGIVAITTGSANDLTVTISSTDIGGNFSVTGLAATNDGTISVAVTNAATIGGNLTLTNAAMDQVSHGLSMSVGTNLTVTGTTAITGETATGDQGATLTVTGNAAFTGAVTLTGGAVAGADAVLNANGATLSATNGILLEDGAAGLAQINLTPTAAQTVTGTIGGNTDGEGTVNVRGGTNLVTFSNTVGTTANSLLAINVGDGTAGGTAKFSADIDATTITIAGTTAASSADFDGNVVGAVNITGHTNGAASATFAGNVTGNITLTKATNDATATFDGAVAQTITGDIDTANDNESTIVVSNAAGVSFVQLVGDSATDRLGTFTVSAGGKAIIGDDDGDGLFAKTVTVGSGATLDLSTAADQALLVGADGSLTVSGGTLKIASDGATGGANEAVVLGTGGTTFSNGSTIEITNPSTTNASVYIDADTNNADITFSGDVTIENSGSAMTSGNTAVIINGDATATTITTTDANIKLVGFGASGLMYTNGASYSTTSTAGDLIVTAGDTIANSTMKSASAIGLTGNDATTLGGIGTLMQSTTGDAGTLATELNSFTTVAQLEDALEQLTPDAGGAASAAVSSSVGASTRTIASRMQTARNGYGSVTGVAAGNDMPDMVMWGHVFSSDAEQDKKTGTGRAYEVDGNGIAFGMDQLLDDGRTRVGGAFSIANSDITGATAQELDLDIDTKQLRLYGSHDYDHFYVDGSLSYAWNDHNQKRGVVIGSYSETASASYDSTAMTLQAGLGKVFKTASVDIEPKVMMTWSHQETDTYTETGAAGANLTVTPEDVDTFVVHVGSTFSQEMRTASGGTMRPEFRIGLNHDLADDTADSTSTFVVGGSSFKTTGDDYEDTTINAGLGFSYEPTESTEIRTDFDHSKRSGYESNLISLTAKLKF